MSELTALERRHYDFYAPAYRILVSGRDLLTSELVEIASVQVDTTLQGFDRFSFTVNGAFDVSRREFVTRRGYGRLEELFAFGTEVEIHMGYRDAGSMRPLHVGMITELSTSFPAAGLPQVTVSGYELSYWMSHGAGSRAWDDQKDSQIVSEIAREYNLTADVQDSRVQHARTEQHQESDWTFVNRLAKRSEFQVLTVNRTLLFRRPASDESAAVTLEWGKGLVSFSPRLSLSAQVTAVEVRGWNPATRETILGRARAGDEPGRDGGQRSGAEYLRSASRRECVYKTRHPVRSQQEADQKARALLKERAEQFIEGTGESIGLPEIQPNANLEIRGLGGLFSKTYFVVQATHTISTSGYRTTFQVRETTR